MTSKRKLTRRKIEFVGELRENLPYSHLPTCRVVLQRLLFILETNNGHTALPSAILTVQKELVDLWTYAGFGDILHQPANIRLSITKLHSSYKALLKTPTKRRTAPFFLKKLETFETSLSSLFAIHVKDLVHSSLIHDEDRNFLLNHWTQTISSRRDTVTQKSVEKKLDRREKRLAQCTPKSPSVSPQPSTSSQHSSPSTSSTSVPPDPEFQPKRHCITPRTSGTTLTVPRNIMTKMGSCADRLLLSNTQLTALTASFVNNCGGDIDDISLSTSTTRRHRKAARSTAASSIRQSFSCSLSQISFDGKILPSLGGFGKDNRVAVVIVQEDENQILSIARTTSGTGEAEATCVKETLDTWELTDLIIACSFDTTSTNTGIHTGGCKILQELLGRQILWLACRHHMGELIVRAAFHTIFGKTNSPVEPLCSLLKDSWTSLNTQDILLPSIPSYYDADIQPLLTYVTSRLHPDNLEFLPRDDYKEFLELALLYLGGSIERKKGWEYHLQRPGADHHARWMSKCIYILKIFLVRHQLKLHYTMKKKVEKMALFVIFAYLQYWFTSPSLRSAASNDLLLYKSLLKFAKVDKTVSTKAATTLKRHTWYLTEENIPFALFDESLPAAQRDELATAISLLAPVEVPSRKPTLPQLTTNSKLQDFVGPRSILLFNLVDVPHAFLSSPSWQESPSYTKVQEALTRLHPVNDSSERALGLATAINKKITLDEESYQNLILAVDLHRKKYAMNSKKDLKKYF